MKKYRLTPFSWVLALLLMICSLFMVIALATSHWFHYAVGTTIQEYGLWQVCTVKGAGGRGCEPTADIGTPLNAVGDPAVRVLLTICTLFCIVGLGCVFLFVNKWWEICSVFAFVLCMFLATIFAWSGIGLFMTNVEKDSVLFSSMTYKWSFILACIAAVVLTILLFLSICYAFCYEQKRNPDGQFLESKFRKDETLRNGKVDIKDVIYYEVDVEKIAPEGNDNLRFDVSHDEVSK